MKSKYTFLIYILCSCFFASAQNAKDYAVLLKATVLSNPPSIKLAWNNDTAATGYEVYKKNKDSTSWSFPPVMIPSGITQFIDSGIAASPFFVNEYYVRGIYSAPKRYSNGYIYAGRIDTAVGLRGKILLLVDENYQAPLSKEINQLKLDLIGDGWYVKTKVIARSASVKSVKSIIKTEYDNPCDTGIYRLKALYLLGRIPIPYSGDIFPDGHTPEHRGAWPADVYYGVMNESYWTDNTVNHDSATDARNHNLIGDGKFDQSYVFDKGNDVALQIGRVDLTDMPEFGLSDTLLVKRYLDKAHQYKTANVNVVRRGLIDDNFGAQDGEAFASSMWSDYSTMFGDSSFSRDYFTSVKNSNYLFSYGSGFGNYTRALGVGYTADFNNDSINTFFTVLFGSYFGDWDSQNNFLRAPLCSPKTGLASMWSGRPFWHFHHMAMGENIGYAARLAQSNFSDFTTLNPFGYAYNDAPTFVHIALMGDPSLRLHYFSQVSGFKFLILTQGTSTINMRWNKHADSAVIGYNIYRAKNINEQFKFLAFVPSNKTDYMDTIPVAHTMSTYMIRAVRGEYTPSGKYYNMSLGVIDSAYASSGSGINELKNNLQITVFPNPVHNYVSIQNMIPDVLNIRLFDITGKLLIERRTTEKDYVLNLQGLKKGMYILKLNNNNEEVNKKIIIE